MTSSASGLSVKSCNFKISISNNTEAFLKLLDLGLTCTKQEDFYLCELEHPSRSVINRLFDVVEDIRQPCESEDNEGISNESDCDSFVVIPEKPVQGKQTNVSIVPDHFRSSDEEEKWEDTRESPMTSAERQDPCKKEININESGCYKESQVHKSNQIATQKENCGIDRKQVFGLDDEHAKINKGALNNHLENDYGQAKELKCFPSSKDNIEKDSYMHSTNTNDPNKVSFTHQDRIASGDGKLSSINAPEYDQEDSTHVWDEAKIIKEDSKNRKDTKDMSLQLSSKTEQNQNLAIGTDVEENPQIRCQAESNIYTDSEYGITKENVMRHSSSQYDTRVSTTKDVKNFNDDEKERNEKRKSLSDQPRIPQRDSERDGLDIEAWKEGGYGELDGRHMFVNRTKESTKKKKQEVERGKLTNQIEGNGSETRQKQDFACDTGVQTKLINTQSDAGKKSPNSNVHCEEHEKKYKNLPLESNTPFDSRYNDGEDDELTAKRPFSTTTQNDENLFSSEHYKKIGNFSDGQAKNSDLSSLRKPDKRKICGENEVEENKNNNKKTLQAEKRIESSEEEEDTNNEYDMDKIQDEESEVKTLTTLIFNQMEYSLAIKLFQNHNNVKHYLAKPLFDNTLCTVEIDDQEVVDQLRKFKHELKKAKIPIHHIKKIQKKWGEEIEICRGDQDEYSMLTLKDTLQKIEKEFPELHSTGKGPSVTTKSSSMMGEDRNSNNCAKIKSTRNNSFKGHYSALVVNIYQKNITELSVDVIVNAANKRLKHHGGVAKAIAIAAGKKLSNECEQHKTPVEVTHHFASTGGMLQAKKVYHAVGPKWDQYIMYRAREDKCGQDLRLTILRCLIQAEQEGYQSIAFPSISAAIFKVPICICVASYLKAVQHFEILRNQYKTEKLKEVHFVDIDDKMVNAITEHFQLYWDHPVCQEDAEFKNDKKLIEIFTRNNKSSDTSSTTRPIMPKTKYASGGVNTLHTGTESSQSAKSSTYANVVQSSGSPPSVCNICTDLTTKMETLPCCDMLICKVCLDRSPKKNICPFCRHISGIVTGDQPSGFMEVFLKEKNVLPGYENWGCITIHYYFHELSYKRPYRTAYIPATGDGYKVVKLLMLAFLRRLIFTKGESLTTGKQNQIIWNGIHHKTTLEENHTFGYPDPGYLNRVFAELHENGVTDESMTKIEIDEIRHCYSRLINNHSTSVFAV